jgi:hypothetical protein
MPDLVALAGWYFEHLGFQFVRRDKYPTLAHFLADASGHVVIELYNTLAASFPD